MWPYNDCLINFHKSPKKGKKESTWVLYTRAVIGHVLLLSLIERTWHDHAKYWASLFYYFTISPRQTYNNAVIRTTWSGVDSLCFRSISFFFCFGFVFITVLFLLRQRSYFFTVDKPLLNWQVHCHWLQVSHHTKLEHRFHSQGHKWLLLVSLKFLAPLSCFSHTKDSKTQYSSNLGGERVLFLSCNYQRLPAFSSLVS